MFIKNAWYAGALLDEVSREPLRRKILGEAVVFYRRDSGEAVAMSDVCPHRFAKMSDGFLVGDDIECPYHGLRFSPDADGKCSHNPQGGEVPDSARLKVYPVEERHGIVWLWTGDVDKADVSKIHDFSRFDDDKLISGYMHAKANHLLLADNIMDAGSHVDYVHEMLKAHGDYTRKFDFVERDGYLLSRGWWIGCEIPKFMTMMWPDAKASDVYNYGYWQAPGTILFLIGLADSNDPDSINRDSGMPAAHIFTPETESTSHYFYLTQLLPKAEEEALKQGTLDQSIEWVRKNTEGAFVGEDKPMLEGQQDNMGDKEFFSLKPALLPCDAASVRLRRIYAKLLAEEQSSAS